MMLAPQAQTLREMIHAGMPIEQVRSKFAALDPQARQEAIDSEKAHLRELVAQHSITKQTLAVVEGLEEWLLTSPTKLEKNEHSRVHRLVEASQRNEVFNLEKDEHSVIHADALARSQVFVVRHDWAAALGPAIQDAGDTFSLPYESCVFEFMMNGRCVIIWAIQPDGGKPSAVPFVETKDGWWCGGRDEVDAWTPFHNAWLQIVAICVALDAEVATREVMRAPAALNKKRERAGKPPLQDFHIIDLSRRHRVAGPGVGAHRSPRLHFRRGHWRHYETHNTWIRWMLVGDPDLGFVDKQYRV